MRKFANVLMWELRNIVRFPIIELLIILLTFQVMSSAIIGARTISIAYVSFLGLPQDEMLSALMTVIAQGLTGAFISTSFIGTVSATMLFAYQSETGLTKFHLSLPIKRTHYFLAKLLACVLVPFLMLVAVGCIAEIFINPISLLYFFSAPTILAEGLLLVGEMVFFVVAVSITISIFTHNTAVSFIGSLAMLYGLQLVDGIYGLPLLPPTSLDQGLFFFLFRYGYWNTYPSWQGLSILLLTPLLSVALLTVSYFYYSRRLNL
jgi:hypothetical protein